MVAGIQQDRVEYMNFAMYFVKNSDQTMIHILTMPLSLQISDNEYPLYCSHRISQSY